MKTSTFDRLEMRIDEFCRVWTKGGRCFEGQISLIGAKPAIAVAIETKGQFGSVIEEYIGTIIELDDIEAISRRPGGPQ